MLKERSPEVGDGEEIGSKLTQCWMVGVNQFNFSLEIDCNLTKLFKKKKDELFSLICTS